MSKWVVGHYSIEVIVVLTISPLRSLKSLRDVLSPVTEG